MIPHLRNPYDFVPLEGRPTRSIPVGADYAYNLGLTGTITCELEIVTPVFVGAVQPKQRGNEVTFQPYRTDTGDLYIPASALKGVVRSVMEAASNSCFGVISDSYQGFPEVVRSTGDYASCTEWDALCPTCALLGMVESESKSEHRQAVALAGRVTFYDAFMNPADRKNPIPIVLPGRSDRQGVVVPIGAPKPAHRKFYVDRSGKFLGRKFYYRTRQWRETLDKNTEIYIKALGRNYRTIRLEALSPKTTLCFCVNFRNLSESELDLLIYGLQIEPNTCHHVGYAKPFGLGSAKITIKSVQTDKQSSEGYARFLTYDTDGDHLWLDYDWEGYADRVWVRKGASVAVRRKLVEILTCSRDEMFLYPDHNKFFRDPNENMKTLQEYQDEARREEQRTNTTEGDSIRDQLKRRFGSG